MRIVDHIQTCLVLYMFGNRPEVPRRVTATSACWFAAMWCRHPATTWRVFPMKFAGFNHQSPVAACFISLMISLSMFDFNHQNSLKHEEKKMLTSIEKGWWATPRLEQDRQDLWKTILTVQSYSHHDRRDTTSPGPPPRTGFLSMVHLVETNHFPPHSSGIG